MRNADKICVIKGGRVAEAGTHTELIARADGEYAKLVNRQLMQASAPTSADGSQRGSQLNLASMASS